MSLSTLVHLPFTHCCYHLKKNTHTHTKAKHVNERQQDASLYNMVHIKVIFEGPFLVKAFSLIHILVSLFSLSGHCSRSVSVYGQAPASDKSP